MPSWYGRPSISMTCYLISNLRGPQMLQDGAYLELISFTHPASHYPPGSPDRRKRDANPWAWKEPGWIDYAFLGSSSTSISELINARAIEQESSIRYDPEVDGGRVRSDGKVLKWQISAPTQEHVRGTAPFFCGDVTPRKWRVRALSHTSTSAAVSDRRARCFRSHSIPPLMHSIHREYLGSHISGFW